jgi:hypothetical protein
MTDRSLRLVYRRVRVKRAGGGRTHERVSKAARQHFVQSFVREVHDTADARVAALAVEASVQSECRAGSSGAPSADQTGGMVVANSMTSLIVKVGG